MMTAMRQEHVVGMAQHRRAGRRGLVACVCLLGWMAPAAPIFGQTESAEGLADEIALTELAPITLPEAGGEQAAAITEPARVSMLDIAAKLALLVLAAYGLAWGAKIVQRSGFRLPHATPDEAGDRLQRCADLSLSGGASLHIIEVDSRPLLLATHGGGDVSLLLDLGSPADAGEPAAETSGPARRESPEDESDSRTLSALKQDDEWQQRRDSLIRALTQQA